MKKLSPFIAMVISMTFTVIIACAVLIHVHENTIVSPNQEQVSVEETPVVSNEQIILNKTIVLENFYFKDMATIPVKIKIQYDSTYATNKLREVNLRSSIIKECHKWSVVDFLTYPTSLHNNLLGYAQ